MKFNLSRMNEFKYYSKMLLRIQTGKGLTPFDYTTRYVQKQIDVEWERKVRAGEPVRFIVLKARRHGVSTYVQARMFHGCHTQSHRQAITIAADDDGCGYIHNMSQIFYEYLPENLKPATKRKNVQEMVFDYPKTRVMKEGGRNYGLKSSLRTVSCTSKAGLGTGNHFIHFSEYAMYRDAEGVRKGVIPTAFDEPGTFVVIESTANGMAGHGGPFYEEWQRAKAGKSVFKPLFYSWLEHEGYHRPIRTRDEREELLDTLDSEERELQDRNKASLEQLNWRRFQISFLGEHGGDSKSGLENFHEQYPSTDREAFIVSGRSVFSRSILKLYYDQCIDEIARFTPYNGKLRKDHDGDMRLWTYPEKGAEYVMAIDSASGEPGSTDYACIEVFKVGDTHKQDWGEQCCEWKARVDADELAKIACIVGKFYNNALAVPEIFGYGHATLGAMIRLDYPNIMRRTQIDAIAKTYLKKYGWNTNPTTKPSMLTLGRYVVNNKMVKIKSRHLVMEMITFVREEGGSGASAYGTGKDDLVMTFLIVLKGIEQEYADNDYTEQGVVDPTSEHVTVRDDEGNKKDKLHYDTYWDEHPSGDKNKSTNWQDL